MTFTTEQIHRLLSPSSIAVVGASESSAWAPVIVDNLRSNGYEGALHFVNPNRAEAFGRPCYPAIREIPGGVEHAIVLTPAHTVPLILSDAVRAGAKGATVVATGFQEAGEEGQALARQLRQWCFDNEFPIIGPNCYGFSNYFTRAFVTRNDCNFPPPGPIAVASQSGGLTFAICQTADRLGVGLGLAVSSGNELVTDSNDLYEYFLGREDIRVIGGTLERIPDPRRFTRIALEARELGKPIVLLKMGRSEASRRVAVAHTGAVTGDESIVDTYLKDLGVVRVHSIEEWVQTADLFAKGGWPRGNRTFFASLSGGFGELTADLADSEGVNLSPLDSLTRSSISRTTGLSESSIHNPFDATFEGFPHFSEFMDIVARSDAFDALLINTEEPTLESQVPEARAFMGLVRGLREMGFWAAGYVPMYLESTTVGQATTREAEIPLARGAVGMRSLANVMWYGRQLHDLALRRDSMELAWKPGTLRTLLPTAVGVVSEADGKKLLRACGITTPAEVVARSAAEAVAAADTIGYPVVMKGVSPDIAHKSESGAIRIGVDSPSAVEAAFASIRAAMAAYNPRARFDGVLVAEQITEGEEFFLGITCDEMLGPIVVAGLGGIYVEILGDVVSATPPFDTDRARTLLKSLRSAPLLDGARGRPALDLEAFAEAFSRLSHLAAAESATLVEMDINPLFVLPKGSGVSAADVLVVLREPADSRGEGH